MSIIYNRFPTWLLLTVITVVLSGCDNFESSPYAAKITGNRNTLATSLATLSQREPGLSLRFAFITDTHDAIDEINAAIDIIRSRGNIDFIIHGGDMTDLGLPKEFMWCRDAMEKSELPFVTVIGNHDCLGNGEDSYEWIFGPKNYSFDVAGVHFVCLNTIALEYDYSEPVPDLNFILKDAESVAKTNQEHPGSITHTVIVMHSRPFDEQFNNNVATPFLYYLQQYPGMKTEDGDDSYTKAFCLCGHNHNFQVTDLYDAGLLFYQGDNIAKRSFMIFTIDEDGYEMEKVEF